MPGWLAAIASVLAVFLVGFAWLPLPNVATRLISDDAYYYLIVGRNLDHMEGPA